MRETNLLTRPADDYPAVGYVLRAEVEELRRFEALIAELSARFVGVPAGRVAKQIEGGLARMVEALHLDRAVLWASDETGTCRPTHAWTRPEIGPAPTLERLAIGDFPWGARKALQREPIVVGSLDDLPPEAARDRDVLRARGVRSLVCIPMTSGEAVVGALTVVDRTREREWPEALVGRLRLVAEIFQSALERQGADEQLQRTVAELRALKDQLAQDNAYLREEVGARQGFGRIVGESGALRDVLRQVEQVGRTDATVLLLGETGTGKELLAAAIHGASARRERPMVRVNCAALPATLVESELFGREKGAYTGALTRQVGRFELAHGSTIFLDEIGDLPLDVQVKLLRVLEEREIERLGDPRPIRVDVRVIAATHRDLPALVREGKFREDLYYRLNVFPIAVPPLRERAEDIPRLVWRFVEELSGALGVTVEGIAAGSMARLQGYGWPGNVRELRNMVERALIVSQGPVLRIEVPEGGAGAAGRSARLADVEREHIMAVLERTAWRIRGKGGAAEVLGLRPTTLETRTARLGIRRPEGARPQV